MMWTKIIGILRRASDAAGRLQQHTGDSAGRTWWAGGPGLGGPGGIGSRSGLPGSQQDLEASAGDRVFFAFDRSDITPEAQQILARQADWLRRYPNVTVTIEGHCDERGTREYNLALGERRAQAVKNVLGRDRASRHPGSRRSAMARNVRRSSGRAKRPMRRTGAP